MVMNKGLAKWWDGKVGERYWLETTDRSRPEIGKNIRAAIKSVWHHQLLLSAKVDDVVLHYWKDAPSEPAIIGISKIAGEVRTKQNVDGFSGDWWVCPLKDFEEFNDPVPLSQLRQLGDDLKLIRDAIDLPEGGSLYFPFEIGDKRPLRPLTAYFSKLPAQAAELILGSQIAKPTEQYEVLPKRPSALAVYVSQQMLGNLEIGIENGVWGCPVPQNAELSIGDWVVFGGGVKGGPRQTGGRESDKDGKKIDVSESWFRRSAEFIVLGRVTSTWFEDSSPIWGDPDVYVHRFTFDLVSRFENVLLEPNLNFSAEASEALRLSALIRQNGGLQSQIFGSGGILCLDDSVITEGYEVDPGDFIGDYDVPTSATARAEQSKLRKLLLARGNSCAICGKKLPNDLLVAAHIKKRSECTDSEKGDLSNIAMLACKLGCDALYEHGYLVVNEDGIVEAGKNLIPSNSHVVIGSGRIGNRCMAHGPSTEKYFSWHRGKFSE